jgi:predicted nucleic acid-binding protein
VAEILRSPDVDLHVPALCDVEVAAGLRRALLRGALSADRADEAVRDYLDLPVDRHSHRGLVTRILELRANLSAYDATYVALAERLAGRLVTADRRLARAVRDHTEVPVLP